MSYIEMFLETGLKNSDIHSFLIKEGFKKDRNPFGYGECLLYVASGNYTVWMCVHGDFIYLNAEYDCGGTVAETEYYFEESDMSSFMDVYYDAVAWVKDKMI